MTRSRPDDLWLEVGRIHKPHGLHGDLAMRAHSGELDALEGIEVLRLVRRSGQATDVRLRDVRPFKQGAILSLEDVHDKDAAERLRGAAVLVRRADLPPLDDDELYLNDLIGLQAVLADGRTAGRVDDAVDTGPVLTLLIVGDHGGAVPFHDDWVGEPDFERGTLPLKRKPLA